ncbi:MAG: YraN family protein [Gammaproteobacteria bacterium]|nr:MAG: YraN family protein [Gammaproteobacteria bacterium]
MAAKKPATQDLGHKAEQQACRFLQQRGLKTLAQNYRCRYGEIDLVMQDDNEDLVFVEVRYRKSGLFGTAADSIDQRKQNKLRKTAEHFLQHHPKLAKLPSRFDVIAIQGNAEYAQCEWLQNAF